MKKTINIIAVSMLTVSILIGNIIPASAATTNNNFYRSQLFTSIYTNAINRINAQMQRIIPLPPIPPAPLPPPGPITPPPVTPPTNQNLIPNPGLEDGTNSPIGWFAGNWGTNDAVFTYPVTSSTGKGAGITINSYVSGDAKWYFDPVAVTPGKFYTFQDKYMATVPTQVVVQFALPSGALSYQQIGTPAASANWQTFQAGFNVPLGVASLTIFHLINSAGTLQTDEYSLTQNVNSNAFGKGMVSLSFDDGWRTNFNTAIPILNAASFKSTQYIITDSINDTANGYMTIDELKTISQQGHEISAHTKTHPDLTAPNVDLQSEILGSKNDLFSKGFSPVETFAYPFGRYNATVQDASKQAGFLGARTVDRGFNDKSTNPLALTVQIVERGGICDGDNAPATTLDQVKNWIDTTAATNTWLILVFHQTDNNSENCYGDTPQTLQSIVDYLKTSNVDVVTVSQGLRQ
ncbi:MAG: hypothetical protein A2528_00175 [Candidatus Staskawiczbacteria bacterium RIFOXYD2_FULL_37_9]|uniref:NodB homology domain-containing protein n=1 Tax=Candidatus Staskawiczbacteria bacterium RIFOXYB1_FULL_37_44 TaxID=1802223 RepID=A0A1G2IU66_9BACT|nr:MAG: hypothetical protein A2358_03360 [Candidatus Staskawiczbacteria bacterium RIFOXYB1_FULL_37_44]OGZ83045.1 MAG: hypothetical protein A2416_01265 [Candidatus Staskawiczbacteria bacterium RIFOXYC1_FULL_37_52]OGZ90145.1 MAG: hypothetical protein A2581_01895 [Candidatus Staskawiczbacteria bacterium RIFOXYD1_FULL_37_110]OGZ93158.1 MAG: hypothetical protein A2528_00175 [Candidatus Staskawiczbacteria bacterium RIFOXYD2_FULL_37_9]